MALSKEENIIINLNQELNKNKDTVLSLIKDFENYVDMPIIDYILMAGVSENKDKLEFSLIEKILNDYIEPNIDFDIGGLETTKILKNVLLDFSFDNIDLINTQSNYRNSSSLIINLNTSELLGVFNNLSPEEVSKIGTITDNVAGNENGWTPFMIMLTYAPHLINSLQEEDLNRFIDGSVDKKTDNGWNTLMMYLANKDNIKLNKIHLDKIYEKTDMGVVDSFGYNSFMYFMEYLDINNTNQQDKNYLDLLLNKSLFGGELEIPILDSNNEVNGYFKTTQLSRILTNDKYKALNEEQINTIISNSDLGYKTIKDKDSGGVDILETIINNKIILPLSSIDLLVNKYNFNKSDSFGLLKLLLSVENSSEVLPFNENQYSAIFNYSFLGIKSENIDTIVQEMASSSNESIVKLGIIHFFQNKDQITEISENYRNLVVSNVKNFALDKKDIEIKEILFNGGILDKYITLDFISDERIEIEDKIRLLKRYNFSDFKNISQPILDSLLPVLEKGEMIGEISLLKFQNAIFKNDTVLASKLLSEDKNVIDMLIQKKSVSAVIGYALSEKSSIVDIIASDEILQKLNATDKKEIAKILLEQIAIDNDFVLSSNKGIRAIVDSVMFDAKNPYMDKGSSISDMLLLARDIKQMSMVLKSMKKDSELVKYLTNMDKKSISIFSELSKDVKDYLTQSVMSIEDSLDKIDILLTNPIFDNEEKIKKLLDASMLKKLLSINDATEYVEKTLEPLYDKYNLDMILSVDLLKDIPILDEKALDRVFVVGNIVVTNIEDSFAFSRVVSSLKDSEDKYVHFALVSSIILYISASVDEKNKEKELIKFAQVLYDNGYAQKISNIMGLGGNLWGKLKESDTDTAERFGNIILGINILNPVKEINKKDVISVLHYSPNLISKASEKIWKDNDLMKEIIKNDTKVFTHGNLYIKNNIEYANVAVQNNKDKDVSFLEDIGDILKDRLFLTEKTYAKSLSDSSLSVFNFLHNKKIKVLQEDINRQIEIFDSNKIDTVGLINFVKLPKIFEVDEVSKINKLISSINEVTSLGVEKLNTIDFLDTKRKVEIVLIGVMDKYVKLSATERISEDDNLMSPKIILNSALDKIIEKMDSLPQKMSLNIRNEMESESSVLHHNGGEKEAIEEFKTVIDEVDRNISIGLSANKKIVI